MRTSLNTQNTANFRGYSVRELKNKYAVHCYTYSVERAKNWIRTTGNSGIFNDKSLYSDSFGVWDESLGNWVG